MGKIKNYIDHWCKKRKITTDGCWLYTGGKRNGYGWVGYKNKQMSLPRAIMIEKTGLHFGNPEMFACHKCDNKLCFNPEHLYWGTRSDNTKDMVKAGTHNWLSKNNNNRAENHPTAKLTNDQVREMRRLNKENGYGTTALSKMFGINVNTINNVIYNKNRFKGV